MQTFPELRVVVASRPPFVFVSNAGNTTYFYGLLVDLLQRIAAEQAANVTLKYKLYEGPSNSGAGMVAELVGDRADVALFPLTRTAARLAVIDTTFSYLDEGLGLLTRSDVASPGPLSVLAPFETTLWILIMCTVIGVAAAFWLLDVYGKWVRRKATAALEQQGGKPAKSVGRAKKGRSHMMVSLMAAAGVPERPERNSWGVSVLYIIYCFFCLIVLSAYTANLTSFLAVSHAQAAVSGLQSLVRDNLLVGVNPNGSTAAYFAYSFDSLATQLQPNVRYCDTPTCVQWVRSGKISAFVSDKPLLQYQANQPPCDLAVVGDAFGPGNLVIGLQKGSALVPIFNSALQRFVEDGTLTSLHRSWFDEQSQCGSDSSLDNNRLGIQQMLGAFVVLAAGIALAFVMGTVENLRWCIVHSPEWQARQEANPGNSWRTRTNTLWARVSSSGRALQRSASALPAGSGNGYPSPPPPPPPPPGHAPVVHLPFKRFDPIASGDEEEGEPDSDSGVLARGGTGAGYEVGEGGGTAGDKGGTAGGTGEGGGGALRAQQGEEQTEEYPPQRGTSGSGWVQRSTPGAAEVARPVATPLPFARPPATRRPSSISITTVGGGGGTADSPGSTSGGGGGGTMGGLKQISMAAAAAAMIQTGQATAAAAAAPAAGAGAAAPAGAAPMGVASTAAGPPGFRTTTVVWPPSAGPSPHDSFIQYQQPQPYPHPQQQQQQLYQHQQQGPPPAEAAAALQRPWPPPKQQGPWSAWQQEEAAPGGQQQQRQLDDPAQWVKPFQPALLLRQHSGAGGALAARTSSAARLAAPESLPPPPLPAVAAAAALASSRAASRTELGRMQLAPVLVRAALSSPSNGGSGVTSPTAEAGAPLARWRAGGGDS